MLRSFLLVFALFVESLFGSTCKGYTELGERVSGGLEELPTIVWHYKDGGFSLEASKCQKDGFVLLHDNEKNYNEKSHKQNSYTLKRGWNYVSSPQNGLDVVKTFQKSSSVLFVYIYDRHTPAWAGYSPRADLKEQMQTTRILDLHSIEPSLGFYIYANKKVTVDLVSPQLTPKCEELLQSGEYGVLRHSVFDKELAKDTKAKIAVATKYLSHYRRGKYTDTRVMLLYPKIELGGDQKLLKYGPVEPRMVLEYAKEYQEKSFFVFDYFTKECYEGLFPSPRIPPYPTLKKLK